MAAHRVAATKEIRIQELIKLSFHFYENIDILMYRYKRYSKKKNLLLTG